MINMIKSIIDRLLESYSVSIIKSSKDWFIPLRITFIIASIIVYCFSIVTISIVVLLIIFFVIPISYFYKVFSHD